MEDGVDRALNRWQENSWEPPRWEKIAQSTW